MIQLQLQLNAFRAKWMSELKPSRDTRLLRASDQKRAQEIAREEEVRPHHIWLDLSCWVSLFEQFLLSGCRAVFQSCSGRAEWSVLWRWVSLSPKPQRGVWTPNHWSRQVTFISMFYYNNFFVVGGSYQVLPLGYAACARYRIKDQLQPPWSWPSWGKLVRRLTLLTRLHTKVWRQQLCCIYVLPFTILEHT